MKSKDTLKEIKQFDIKELTELLNKNKINLQQLKLDLELGKLKNYREIRQLRKEIAVVLTLINKKVYQIINEEPSEVKENNA